MEKSGYLSCTHLTGHQCKRQLESLLGDLKSTTNNSENNDVNFICSDGKAVYACRWLLAERCPYFDSMFNIGMRETNMSQIPLPSIRSQVMLCVVDFLYTGTMCSYALRNWRTGFELLEAAQFFMLPAMTLVIQKNLQWIAKEACTNEGQYSLMYMLNVALEFQNEWDEKETILQQIIHHIHNDWFEEIFTFRLSRNAVNYLLCNSRHKLDGRENQSSMEEYYILRNIVLWHVQLVVCGRNKDRDVQTVARKILPPRELLWEKMLEMPDVDQFISDISPAMELSDPTAVLNSLLGIEVCKDSLNEMLQRYINLACIPTSLLLTTIHDLRLFHPRQLLKDFLCGSLSRCVQRSVFRTEWRFNSGTDRVRVESDGHISIQKKCLNITDVDTVVGVIPVPRSSDTYQWSFTILELDAAAIDLGFIFKPHGDLHELQDIVKRGLRAFRESRILRIDFGDEDSIKMYMSRTGPKNLWRWGEWDDFFAEVDVAQKPVVNFKFSASQRTWEVSCGRAAVLENLPDQHIIPVVSFYGWSSGKGQSVDLITIKLAH